MLKEIARSQFKDPKIERFRDSNIPRSQDPKIPRNMVFRDRREAGRFLAERLIQLNIPRPFEKTVVLGLARGGIPVASELAQHFHLPLDVMVIRKIGHPQNEEFAVGAIGPKGFHTWDPIATYISPDYLAHAIRHEDMELRRRERVYRAGRPPLENVVKDTHVMLVDDGIATGITIRLAVNILRHMNAKKITVAVPVAAPNSVASLQLLADNVVVLHQPSDFAAVGAFYQVFPQVTDNEVTQCLQNAL